MKCYSLSLRLDEREQVLVDLVLVRRAHAVRGTLVDLEWGSLADGDELTIGRYRLFALERRSA